MQEQERPIVELVKRFHALSQQGDVEGVLALMSDDVVFTVLGRPPFGKREFAEGMRQMSGKKLESSAEVLEATVRGGVAWSRVALQVSLTGPDGKRAQREGYAMSIYERQPDGRWLLSRDANLLGPPK
jgi:uncharacterized protein (TIGR02246 family)